MASTTALNTVENEIPNISDIVKKADYGTKTSRTKNKICHHDYDKYITTPKFNSLTAENFAARLKQANLASKSDIASFVKKTDCEHKLKDVTSNKIELNGLSKNFKAISTKALTKDLINNFSILNGEKCFSSGILQNYLEFIPAKKYIK